MDVGAAREATEHAVCTRRRLRNLDRLVGVDEDNLVEQRLVQDIGNEASANPSNLVRSRSATREDWGLSWLHSHDLGVRANGLEVAPNASDRASRANTSDNEVHLPLRLLPDLGASRLEVDLGVVLCTKLVRVHCVRDRRKQLLLHGDGTLHAQSSWSQDELRTENLEQAATLLRHSLWHRQDDTVATRHTKLGKCDACVATGALDQDGRSWDQDAIALGLGDDAKGKAILDGGHRVFALKLQGDRGLGLVQVLEVDHRRPANEVGEGVGDAICAVEGRHCCGCMLQFEKKERMEEAKVLHDLRKVSDDSHSLGLSPVVSIYGWSVSFVGPSPPSLKWTISQ